MVYNTHVYAHKNRYDGIYAKWWAVAISREKTREEGSITGDYRTITAFEAFLTLII